MTRLRSNLFLAAAMLLAAIAGEPVRAEQEPVPAGTTFARDVAPFLAAHCVRCHGGEEPEAKLALDRFKDSANVQQDFAVWEKVVKMLNERQMPPADEPQPAEQDVRAVVGALQAELAGFDCTGVRRPGRVTLRRLNRAEYNNTVRDLLAIDFRPADDFPSDDVGHGFDNIGDVLSMSPILFEKYLAAAEAVMGQASATEEGRKRIMPFSTDSDRDSREVMRRNMEAFATRAFRRPVTDAELERLSDLRRAVRENGGSSDASFRAACVAVLSSPHFLFRVEQDPAADDEDGIRELSDYEVATRLSYFLWSSMPDEELFGLAKEGKLRDRETLEAQARRMLLDPRARALVDNFAGQWLQLRDVDKLSPDPERYPAFDEALRTAMRRETELFFEALIRDDRSVLDFLTADFSYVNARLARHYGIEGVAGDEFRRVALPEDRRGVLTQASILMLTSNPTRTSPVKRGKWILENFLGEPPPPPPPGVEELDEEAETLGSLRERMEQHRANPSCAVCHTQMDALGFGLENFDGVGAWRERDGRFAINAAGELPGGRGFTGPAELMDVLSREKREQFCRCLTEKMLTYALGRGLGVHDRCAVNTILARMAEEEFRFSSLVSGIVTSEPFLMRESRGDD
jgi:mono/diheme cytochrome c family protein